MRSKSDIDFYTKTIDVLSVHGNKYANNNGLFYRSSELQTRIFLKKKNILKGQTGYVR